MIKKLRKLLVIFAVGLVALNSSGVTAFAAREASSAEEAATVEESQPTITAIPEPDTSIQTPPADNPGASEATSANEASDADGETSGNDTEDNSQPQSLETTTTESTNSTEQPGTGNQNDSGNMGETAIDTGNATAAGTIYNSANTTTINPTPGSCNGCIDSVQASNTGNGTGSNNDITVDNSSNNSTTIDNNANVSNTGDFDVTTGNNIANQNVGSSSITTGDANISASMITSVNETGLNLAEFNIVEDYVGDIYLTLPDNFGFGCSTCGFGDTSAQNTGNGSDSDNNILLDNTNNNNTLIENDADIINNLYLDGNTGDNETSKNTGGDNTINTGDVNIAANLINLANSTIFGGAAFVVNVFGNLVGDIIFPDSIPNSASGGASLANSGNGTNSDNLINFSNTNNSNINLNNDAYVENNLVIDAETGNNETSRNTGGNNSVDTGNINVNAEVINVVNTNFVGGSDEPLWLILVNNMGTWTGQIVGSLTGQNYAGSGFTFTEDPTGELLASNENNGSGSNNLIDITNTNNDDFTVNNNANVVNNLYIDANTGGNQAKNNTGGNSTITTGDVNVAASVINFINTNLIGRNIMLGIINVFGSWTGNAVPPGQEKLSVGGSESNNSNNDSSGGGNNSSNGGNSNNSATTTTQVLGSTNEGNGNNSSNSIASLFKATKTTTGNTGSDEESGSGNGTQFNSIVYANTGSGFWKNQYLWILIPLTAGTLSVLLRRKFTV